MTYLAYKETIMTKEYEKNYWQLYAHLFLFKFILLVFIKKIMLNISVEDNNQLKALHVSYPETELGRTRLHQGIGRYLYANVCHHWIRAGRAL